MRRRRLRTLLAMGVLVALCALVLSACSVGGEAGGQEEEAKARPLPEEHQDLRPGKYHSVEFKPSLSLRVCKGWSNTEAQLPDSIEVGGVEQQEETGWINFVNVNN
jgi:hypothetical protein